MRARYLTFFSYIGTKFRYKIFANIQNHLFTLNISLLFYLLIILFRSSEKIWPKGDRNYPDPESIQGLMEIGLLKLRPLNYPNLTLSSR